MLTYMRWGGRDVVESWMKKNRHGVYYMDEFI